ncbi:hypothetical protein BST61_g1731 [Cercospora zeina]
MSTSAPIIAEPSLIHGISAGSCIECYGAERGKELESCVPLRQRSSTAARGLKWLHFRRQRALTASLH